jgi:hypothetical protein
MNGARELSNYLHTLRERLELVEIRLENEKSSIDRRELSDDKTNDRVEEIFRKQGEVFRFNICGKLIPVDKCIILECELDNILTQMIHKIIIDTGTDNTDIINEQLSDIMIDRNRKNFRCIIDILRRHDDVKKGRLGVKSVTRIPYHIERKKINVTVLKEDLAFYFLGTSYDRIFEDFIITYSEYMGKNDSTETIKMLYSVNTTVSYFLQGFKLSSHYPDERLEIFKAENIDDIKSLDGFKAIFADFESEIIFSFADVVKCKMIEMRPFWGDFEMWYPGNGADSNIYYSLDGVNWQFLSMIPPDYGFDIEMLHYIEFDEKELKFVKFEAKNVALSIAYIKFS